MDNQESSRRKWLTGLGSTFTFQSGSVGGEPKRPPRAGGGGGDRTKEDVQKFRKESVLVQKYPIKTEEGESGRRRSIPCRGTVAGGGTTAVQKAGGGRQPGVGGNQKSACFQEKMKGGMGPGPGLANQSPGVCGITGEENPKPLLLRQARQRTYLKPINRPTKDRKGKERGRDLLSSRKAKRIPGGGKKKGRKKMREGRYERQKGKRGSKPRERVKGKPIDHGKESLSGRRKAGPHCNGTRIRKGRNNRLPSRLDQRMISHYLKKESIRDPARGGDKGHRRSL